MTQKNLVTDYFSLHNAKQFKESISEPANNIYYVFAGRSSPYSNLNDDVANVVNSNFEVNINSYKQMVFGKKVSNTDVKIMVPRYDWVANTTYTSFRSNTDLSACNYYAVVNAISNFHVFKVLDNNNDSPSTVPPNFAETGADDEYYRTSDGYVWKYMYTIDRGNFDKFATENFIPVIPNSNVSSNAISGAIDLITLSYNGSNYNTYFANTFLSSDISIGGDETLYNLANNANSSNNFYNNSYLYISGGKGIGQIRKIVGYSVSGSQKIVQLESIFTVTPDSTSSYEITPSVDIVGDGSGAIARAVVNTNSSNSISKIEIIERGSGYTYASANVIGNTGGISNAATLEVILGPKGGHGYDAEAELGGKYLGISVTFANSESNTISVENDFRTFGLIKDPLFANVTLIIDVPTGVYTVNETVIQQNTNASGIIDEITPSTLKLSNVSGIFTDSKVVVGQTTNATANVFSYEINGITKNFNTFDNRHKFTYTSSSGTFKEDELVYQTATALSNAFFHSNDANYIYLTDKKGTFNPGNTIIGTNSSAFASLLSYYPPDIVEGSGEVLYIENVDPIERSIDQSETIKLILKF
ncbi:hypothetical protein EB118_02995 [bacterium]|nr:hypothetical protein [bacterium]